MYCTNFEYAGEKLSDYGMIMCHLDSNSGLETVSSGADITFNQVKSSGSNKFNLYYYTYESVYTTTFQICKNPCLGESQNEMHLSTDEISALQRWLCRKEYHRFKIDQDGYEFIYWNTTFSSKQIELNGQIIVLELTLYTDAPFAYIDEISIEHDCSADISFDLYDSSDEIGYIIPSMKIKFLSNGNFILTNSMDNKIMKISNCIAGEIIDIDGKNQLIFSSMPSHNIAKDFNYFFPKIINTYENRCNTFTPNLDCEIKITYSPIRKVGL